MSWSTCDRTCDNGSRTRLRPCQTSDGKPTNSDSCPGSSVETETCNDGSCPSWSNWSSWNDCSVDCDGGIQSRTRQCQDGDENDCPGSSTDEQQCNGESCESDEMVYWENHFGICGNERPWKTAIRAESSNTSGEPFPDAETFLDQCVSYCLSHDGCIAAQTLDLIYDDENYYFYYDPYDSRHCEICDSFMTSKPVYRTYPNNYGTQRTWNLAVVKDYYDENCFYLSDNPDDCVIEIEGLSDGLCGETRSYFGKVNYLNLDGKVLAALDEKNVVQEQGFSSTNCARRCFGRAGCSAFFYDGDECSYIIGAYSSSVESNTQVALSGALNGICPSTAFRSSFTRRSQFYCLIWAPDEADDITDRIVAVNTGNSDTPLRQWIFEGRTDNPLIRTSQYISISMPDMEGIQDTDKSDTRYRQVRFSIETHVRIAEDASQIFIPSERRKRSPTDLDEILTEIEAIEQQASDYILNGDMALPDNFEVAATGPIETVEFVQTSNDGSVAADCSSGTCKCSPGFIDNGNGCEEMTEEQAATTTVQSGSASDWPLILVEKLTKVFADNRPDKPRTELLKKWQKLSRKFVKRYETVAANDCQFSENYEDDSVDFDSINTCRVSFSNSNLF